VGVGSALFFALAVFGLGLMLASTRSCRRRSRRELDECHRWLHHGIALALLLSPVLMLLAWVGIATLGVWDLIRRCSACLCRTCKCWCGAPAAPDVRGAAPLSAGHGRRQPVMFALVSANLINAVANWVLIYGRFGAPALGTTGAAWATLASRIYMALVLVVVAVAHDARHRSGLFRVAPVIELTGSAGSCG